MKQSIQLKLGQQLTMTPQLQQAIRLLQLSTLDLQQEIQEALEANPLLEVEEENFADNGNDQQENYENTDEQSANTNDESFDREASESPQSESSVSSDESLNNNESNNQDSEVDWQDDHENVNEMPDFIPSELPVDSSWEDVYQQGTYSNSQDSDELDPFSRQTSSNSLQDHLIWQLNLTQLSDVDRFIGESIIDAVAPSGILAQSIDEIHEGINFNLSEVDVDLDEVLAILHLIQQFEPSGVATQNLQECLLVQLKQSKSNSNVNSAATLIVNDYLHLLANRDFKQLMRRTRLKEPELKDAIKLIQSLNPRPGDSIEELDVEYVVPDVFVKKIEERWKVELNPDIAPKIRINPHYASMIRRADSSRDNTFLRNNLQEARWFMKSLQSRNETLMKVATCIVEHQRDFLEYGDEAMKPLVLHDIAQAVDMHESTISRVTTKKFMHTPQGIFELKYFFSSHVSTASGGECSSTAIRARIKKLIADEDTRKPLSDSKITNILAEEGIKVARRTIAKYRESLNIPASNERKQLV